MNRRLISVILACPVVAAAQTAGRDPMTLPTRDAHQNLTVVADPYLAPDRYKDTFGKKSPYEDGIVAIELYFRNDNDAPIRLNLDTIRLVVSEPGEDRQRLPPLSSEDVADRMILKAHSDATLPRRPLSLPMPKPGKGKAWDEADTALRSVALSTDVLPPHATTHGFLYFDVNHEFDAVRHSHVYIPDLSFMTDNKALFFFEIDLSVLPAP